MSVRSRWLLVAVVLVLAGAVALWPRGSGEHGDGAATARAQRPEPDLVALRAAAQLAPCPTPPASAAPGGTLAGTKVSCLADGASLDLGAALGGRTTLVNVWAHWCGPCRDELPVLAEYAASPGALPVLTMQVRGTVSDGLEMLKELKVRLPAVLDQDNVAQTALKVGTPPVLPASYLVREDGQARRITSPLLFRSVAEVRKAVTDLTGGTP